MFIISLAVSDLVVGAIVMPISVIYIFTIDWLFGVAICQIWIAVDYTASTASILNLFILSLDRYWSVTSPLRYIRKRTKRRAKRMIAVVWCVSALWIIPVVGWHYFASGGIRTVPSDVCDTEYASNLVFKVITAIFNFYLPLGIMYMLYGKVFLEIRKRSQFEIGQKNTTSAENRYSTAASCMEDSDPKNSTFGEDETPPENDVNSSQRDSQMTNHVTPIAHIDAPVYQMDYVYDETVADSTTERVDRYVITRRQNVPSRTNSYKSDVVTSSVDTDLTNATVDTTIPTIPSKKGSKKYKIFTKNGKKIRQTRSSKPKLNYTFPKSDSNIAVKGDSSDNPTTIISKSSSGVTLRAVSDQPTGKSPSKGTNSTGVISTSTIRRPIMNFRDRMNVLNRSSQLSKEIKAARQLGVIMGAFTLCFVPYFILFLYVGFCVDCIDVNVMTAFTWIGYLNSTLNPCLYPLCNLNFRRKFRKMLSLRAEQKRLNNVERNSYVSARFD